MLPSRDPHSPSAPERSNDASKSNDLGYPTEVGFFTRPAELGTDKVVKRLSGTLTDREASELDGLHASFISDLRGIGIQIPDTSLAFVPTGNKFKAEIIQARFEQQEIARNLIRIASPEDALRIGRLIVNDAITFLVSPLHGTRGFHPTFRNYAVRDGVPYMIDTFPPYPSEPETRKLMERHAPSLEIKLLMRFGGQFVKLYTQEYYDAVAMIAGIVDTFCRVRPELAPQFKEMVREECMDRAVPSMDRLHRRLDEPATVSRKILLQHTLVKRRL